MPGSWRRRHKISIFTYVLTPNTFLSAYQFEKAFILNNKTAFWIFMRLEQKRSSAMNMRLKVSDKYVGCFLIFVIGDQKHLFINQVSFSIPIEACFVHTCSNGNSSCWSCSSCVFSSTSFDTWWSWTFMASYKRLIRFLTSSSL